MNTLSIVSAFCLICGTFANSPQKQWNAEPESYEQDNWHNQPLAECEGKINFLKFKQIILTYINCKILN